MTFGPDSRVGHSAAGCKPARAPISSSGTSDALRRAMRGSLPPRCHGPHTEFLTVPVATLRDPTPLVAMISAPEAVADRARTGGGCHHSIDCRSSVAPTPPPSSNATSQLKHYFSNRAITCWGRHQIETVMINMGYGLYCLGDLDHVERW